MWVEAWRWLSSTKRGGFDDARMVVCSGRGSTTIEIPCTPKFSHACFFNHCSLLKPDYLSSDATTAFKHDPRVLGVTQLMFNLFFPSIMIPSSDFSQTPNTVQPSPPYPRLSCAPHRSDPPPTPAPPQCDPHSRHVSFRLSLLQSAGYRWQSIHQV
jgi:hypothetical protein